jgi:hypothetical protein
MTRRHTRADQLIASARLRPSGWVAFYGVPGLESHVVEVRATIVNGSPYLTDLQMIARSEDPKAEALTYSKIRALPVRRLAEAAIAIMRPTDPDARTDAALWHALTGKVDLEQVAAIWRQAHAGGRSPRVELSTRLGLHPRTAFRWLAKAREAGLIPESNHPSRSTKRN